ncbi:MAG: hypothetical protein ABI254_00845, partial [Chthoniobacterales bacterium]
GVENIGGNNYPIATSRVYNAELHVESGYTLAIGGLEEAEDDRLRNGIPYLKDIPILGEAFKSFDHKRSKKNLMIFITPTMLSPRTNKGLPDKPESVTPAAPTDPVPPAFTVNGQLVGGSAALENAMRWVIMRYNFYKQTVKDHNTERKTITEIKDLKHICEMLVSQIIVLKNEHPDKQKYYNLKIEEMSLTVGSLHDLEGKARKDILRF